MDGRIAVCSACCSNREVENIGDDCSWDKLDEAGGCEIDW